MFSMILYKNQIFCNRTLLVNSNELNLIVFTVHFYMVSFFQFFTKF